MMLSLRRPINIPRGTGSMRTASMVEWVAWPVWLYMGGNQSGFHGRDFPAFVFCLCSRCASLGPDRDVGVSCYYQCDRW